MRGHSLFVFDLPQVHPQKLTLQYLRRGLSIVHAAPSPHFALGKYLSLWKYNTSHHSLIR